jgi:prolipoprotein diacylglyceryl transferase
MPRVLDALVPTLPVAQAIGRWGNWFNQELFGRPTDLPWGLSIDVDHRPAAHLTAETFHPTFLYEGLWNLALAAILVRVDRRGVLKPGRLVGLWVCGYGLGRLWVESLRIDHASLVAGVRVNIWMSLVAIVIGGAVAVTSRNYRDAA